MTNYIEKELLKMNPCGIKNDSSTHCKYVQDCSELEEKSGGFICLSKTGHKLAQYFLYGSDIETEKKDLKNFIDCSVGIDIVDPNKKIWKPKKLQSSEVRKITEEIITRGKRYYNTACMKKEKYPNF